VNRLRQVRRLRRVHWGAVSLADWRLFLAAWGWLLIFDLALRTTSFPRVQALAARPLAKRGNVDSAVQDILATCLQAVERARAYHLYPMTCLRRSLTLQKLLAGQGVAAALKIGVSKRAGFLQSHAWIEVEGQVIGEPEVVEERYRVLLGRNNRGSRDTA